MIVTRLTNDTGAEVRGIDLGQPISETDKATLNRAFVEHSVLVIRDQHLTPQQVLAAVGLFGTVFPQHNTRFALPDCPQIHYLSNQDRFPDGRRYIPGEGWHTDHSNDTRPPKATVLHAVELPAEGGDTQFANMAAAYSALPKAMQERIGGLLAIPVADTLKREDRETPAQVLRTEDRAGLWQAQTPQLFRYGVLRRAFAL